jgi:hypothetical protein
MSADPIGGNRDYVEIENDETDRDGEIVAVFFYIFLAVLVIIALVIFINCLISCITNCTKERRAAHPCCECEGRERDGDRDRDRERRRYRPRFRDREPGYYRSSSYNYNSGQNYGCRDCSSRPYQYQPRSFSTSTFPVYPRVDISSYQV